MQEKVLITSKLHHRADYFLRGIFYLCLLIAVLFIIIGIIISGNKRLDLINDFYDHCQNFKCYLCGEDVSRRHIINEHLQDNFSFLKPGSNSYMMAGCFLLLAGAVALFIFLLSKCYLTVTNKNVIGKLWYGKQVILPIHQITAYGTEKFFANVLISTPSGHTRFVFIANYQKISNTLRKLINQQQDCLFPATSKNKTLTLDKMHTPLLQLSKRLQDGTITQEEYEMKKNEILGL